MYKRFEHLPFSIENDVLRMQINQYFESQLARGDKEKKPTKEEKNKAIYNTIKEYPEILDYYIKEKELDGKSAVNVSEEKVDNTQIILINNTKELIDYLTENTKFYEENKKTAYEEAWDRVQYLKDSIENNDCYKLFYNGDEAIAKEKDLQLMFRLVCYGSPSDINSEVNNGRGPVDYKISKGAYKTEYGIKVIIYFTEDEYKRVIGILEELELIEDKNVVLIDARKDNKISASNVK